MYKLSTAFSILVLLCGCAAPPPHSASFVSAGTALFAAPASATTALAGAPPAPAESVDVDEYAERTVCEKIQHPGSRIVIGERCYTQDQSAATEEARREMVRLQVEQLRKDQERREIWQQRMEMERQRELMRRAIQAQQGR